MDWNMVFESVATQGPWCLMFVWLFYMNTTQSKERESKLLQVIESYNEKLAKITDTIEAINNKIDRFHGK